MITVLTGGTGGAKFVDGLRRVVAPEELTIIVNTGDDMRWWGLYISPDVDSIVYMLAGRLSRERGWGVDRDTFFCLQTMLELNEPAWFSVGDRDLAMHLLRTNLLAAGKTLTEATAEIAKRLGIGARVLPMTDSRVETCVLTAHGEMTFEEYFVQRRYRDEVEAIRFAGAAEAVAAPAVLDAIRSSELIILAPSNPVTSIGPILAVPGIREALRETRAKTAAVSPIVGNSAVTGPAAALLRSQGFESSIAGVADYYRDFLDLLVVDLQDEQAAAELRKREELDEVAAVRIGAIRTLSLSVHCTSTMMRSNGDRAALARSVLDACDQSPTIAIVGEASMIAECMILVPVKNLSGAKQRLSPILNAEERYALAQAMCEDVLQTLASWQRRLAVAIVTGDPFARDLAARFNFEVIADSENPGETRAIEMATTICRNRGAHSTLVIPADIPLIEAEDLQKIVDAAPPQGSVLVTDAARRGTNAAWRSPADLFPLRFGNDSFQPHLASAKATGLPCVTLELPSIARDVDRPNDLFEIAAASGTRRAQRLIRSWRLDQRMQLINS